MVVVKKSSQTNKSSTNKNKASANDDAAKLEKPDRPLIPKSKIPPSVSNFEEVAQDPLKHILQFTKRRLTNLESRRDKLSGYQKRLKKGEEVDQKKLDALSKYNEVLGSITLAEEFSNLFTFLLLEVDKVKQQLQISEVENQKKKELKKSQFIAKFLTLMQIFATNEEVLQDFREGKNKAAKLSPKEIKLLLKFSQLFVFSSNPGDNVVAKAEKCGEHLNRLYESATTRVCDSTYANVRTVYEKMSSSNYFKNLPDFNPKIEVEEPEQEEIENTASSTEQEKEALETVDEPANSEEFSPQTTEEQPSSSDTIELSETTPPATTTQDLDDYTYPMPEPQVEPTAALSKSAFEELQAVIGNVGDPQLQQIQMSFMSFQVEEASPEPAVEEKPQPVHTIEEVLADVQGPYNFLQDSIIDLDNPERGNSPLSGPGLQPSAGVPDTISSSQPSTEGMMPNQYNPVSDRTMEKESSSFLPNGPTIISNEVSTSHLHHTSAANSLYYVPTEKTDKYPESKLLSGQEAQLKQPADNLGMGQTTFGANEPNYNVGENNQFSGSTLHAVDAFQQQQSSEISMMKPLPDNKFASTPFSSLHGNSQSPFEGSLSGNKIPDPIPLPNNASSLSQTLSAADPPTTHIPFPNDKMSGYHGFATSAPNMDNTASMQPEERNEQFASLQEKQHQTALLSAGDAVHIPSPVLKLDSSSVEDMAKDTVTKTEESNDMASSSANIEDKSLPTQGNAANSRNTRAPAPYQNNPSNYNRGSNGMPRQVGGAQGQAMGGFYQNRSGNYRPSHNRGYGNFDSMGHPKHFGGPGGGYQHSQGGAGMAAPFPSHYSRQDNNGMYGGGAQRRGGGGSGRSNRGYPARMNNMRSGAPNNNYNRSRTFRPQNSDQVV